MKLDRKGETVSKKSKLHLRTEKFSKNFKKMNEKLLNLRDDNENDWNVVTLFF